MNTLKQTRTGTITGTLLVLLANITTAQFSATIILAAVGATASFVTAYTLKSIVQWWKNRRHKKRDVP